MLLTIQYILLSFLIGLGIGRKEDTGSLVLFGSLFAIPILGLALMVLIAIPVGLAELKEVLKK